MEEIWVPIKGYEELYTVSNLGNVKGKRGILKPCIRSDYYAVALSKNSKSTTFPIHRIVACNFLENPNGFNIVNHLNGNKTDNRVINLEWTTSSGNVKHAKEMSLIKNETRNVFQYTLKGDFIKQFPSVKMASEECKIPEINIYSVCYGSNKSSGGFIWKYDNFKKDNLVPNGKVHDKYPKYIVTNNGKVYSLKTKRYLKYHINSGYRYVDLYNKDRGKFSIHYLVAYLYLPNPNNFQMINHKDGNKENNSVDNLEWCTFSYNMKHYINLKKLAKNNQ